MRISSEVRELIIFVSGLAVGSVSTFFVVRKYYQNKTSKEIASVERAFTERLNQIEAEKDQALDVARDAIVNSNEYKEANDGQKEYLRNKSTLSGFKATPISERVDYTKFFDSVDDSKTKVTLGKGKADEDHPRDDGEEGEARPILSKEETVDRSNVRSKIYEITDEAYGEKTGWEAKEVYYYIGDGVTVDEDEEVIGNPEYLFGYILSESGFDSNKERSIYVRNEYISTDFLIIKVDGSYQ